MWVFECVCVCQCEWVYVFVSTSHFILRMNNTAVLVVCLLNIPTSLSNYRLLLEQWPVNWQITIYPPDSHNHNESGLQQIYYTRIHTCRNPSSIVKWQLLMCMIKSILQWTWSGWIKHQHTVQDLQYIGFCKRKWYKCDSWIYCQIWESNRSVSWQRKDNVRGPFS